MKLDRRRFLSLTGAIIAVPVASRVTWAQAYPTRPIRLIVAFPAGGVVDLHARLIGQLLSDRLGQPFIIENRPGAGGNIGTEAFVRSAPDGYTLLQFNASNSWNAGLYTKLNYDILRDIVPCLSG